LAAFAIWPLEWLLSWLLRARGQLFVWVPVFIGAGGGIWFALPFEPRGLHYSVLCAGAVLAMLGIWRGPDLARPIFVAALCMAAGFGAAGLRAHTVAAPMLDFRYYGPVQGRVIEVDRSGSDALRITLDKVVLGDVAPQRTPKTVRISLQAAEVAPQIGQAVILTAHLSAPEGASAPDAFDFRRMAFFNGLGAVGYTRSPVLLWAEADAQAQHIPRLRAYLTASMLAHMPSQAGAFATGAMTGDRAAITQDTVQALRDSNLAHLLAISGMNLAFISGFVFMLIRYGVALAPMVALRVNAKKIAAVLALAVALFYWALSGANVSTTRAMVMIAVMLGAVLLDRRAISMRSVAIAGIVLLLITPESLLDPGFQLSFSATVVLVGAYGALDREIMRGRVPRWVMPLFALVLTSVLAGAATAPYAAAHFNRFTDYGLLANLLTVPVMSLLMAAGVMAALLAPFGAAAPALWVMEMSGAWILAVAHWVAGLDGAVTAIVAPPPAVLPLITFGGILLLVWQGRRRMLGLPVLALALGLWALAPRPDLLISADGRLAGLMGPQGRALSHEKGAGFAAKTWLEDDGDLAAQADGAARAGFAGPKTARSFAIGPFGAVLLSGKGVASDFAQACAAYDLVILPAAFDPAELPKSDAPCLVLDRQIFDNTGALAARIEGEMLILHPTRARARAWSSPRPIVPPLILNGPKPAKMAQVSATP
jgi:competence protein ComEC